MKHFKSGTEEFKREVDRFLTGRESEPWELLYFKAHKNQLAVIERALDFLAGANN